MDTEEGVGTRRNSGNDMFEWEDVGGRAGRLEKKKGKKNDGERHGKDWTNMKTEIGGFAYTEDGRNVFVKAEEQPKKREREVKLKTERRIWIGGFD